MIVCKGCLQEISFLHLRFGDVFRHKDCLYMKVDMQSSDKKYTLAVSMYIENEALVIPIRCELNVS